MAFHFKFPRMPSPIFWLQAAACGIVGWSLVHGGLAVGSGEPAPPAAATPVSSDVAPGGSTAPSASPAASPAPAAASQLAAAPSLGLALSRIDVIVTHNDTLDRIFRRLKLSLADLASPAQPLGLRAEAWTFACVPGKRCT